MIAAAQWLRIWVFSMGVLGSNAIIPLFADPVTFFMHLLPHDDCSIRVFRPNHLIFA